MLLDSNLKKKLKHTNKDFMPTKLIVKVICLTHRPRFIDCALLLSSYYHSCVA